MKSVTRSMLGLIGLLLSGGPSAHAGDVLINEWNVVSAGNFIKGSDSRLGKVQGNAGNWCELLVVADHTDMRGWQLQWAEIGGGDSTDGTDFWLGNGAVNQGTVTFSESPVWADLRAGTVITIAEEHTILDGSGLVVAAGSDPSSDPASGDWWIHVSTFANAAMTVAESELVVAISNITTDRAGSFKVGKADWIARLIDSGGDEIQGRTGEGVAAWRGAGISNEEGGALKGPGRGATIATWAAITPGSDLYGDTEATSFGMPNVSYDAASRVFTTIQDLTILRDLGSMNGVEDAPPMITSVTSAGGVLVVVWTSTPGEQFKIETSPDLKVWSPAPGGSVDADAGASVTSATVTLPAGGAYLRVRRL